MGERTTKAKPEPLDQALSGISPYLLGQAEYSGPLSMFNAWARKELQNCYDNDPYIILTAARQAALALANGEKEAKSALRHQTRDFARWLMLDQLDGGSGLKENNFGLLSEASTIVKNTSFTRALAHAGANLVQPRLDEAGDTVLMRFAGVAKPNELDELISFIPVSERAEYLNLRNKNGLAAIHHLALTESHAGNAAILANHGAKLDAPVFYNIGEEGAAKGTVAHLAVLQAQPALVAELMSLDRSLFIEASTTHEQEYTPLEVGLGAVSQLVEQTNLHMAGVLIIKAFTAAASRGRLQAVASRSEPAEPPLVDLVDLKIATNLAAIAADRRELPYGDVIVQMQDYLKQSAPRPVFSAKKVLN